MRDSGFDPKETLGGPKLLQSKMHIASQAVEADYRPRILFRLMRKQLDQTMKAVLKFIDPLCKARHLCVTT